MNDKEIGNTDLATIFEAAVEINRAYDKVHHRQMDLTESIRDDLHHIIDEMFEYIEAHTTDKYDHSALTSVHEDGEAADIVIMSIGFFVHYVTWKIEKIARAVDHDGDVTDHQIANAAKMIFMEKLYTIHNRDWEAKKNGGGDDNAKRMA